MKQYMHDLLHRIIVKLSEVFHIQMNYERWFDAYEEDLYIAYMESGSDYDCEFEAYCLNAYNYTYVPSK